MAVGYDARSLQAFKEAYELSIEKACAVLNPEDRVLEVGCGTGILALGVADCAGSVVATDISPAMIDVARGKAEDQEVDNVTFETHDGYALPYESRSFDAVLVFNVLHFVKEPDRVVQEAHRLLKPGGYLVTATDCYGEPVPLGMRLKLGLQRLLNWVGVIPFAWYYQRAALRALFEENGFEVVATEELHAVPVNYYVLAYKQA
jgi:ubiquinone/menaquinone biosynthesis C-methylase UbiE